MRQSFRGARVTAAKLTNASGKTVRKLRYKRSRVTIDLRGLPKGRFTVRVTIRLRSGRVVRARRTYTSTCKSAS